MFIILSQKIDSTSQYLDEVFETYHYPARYKNQIHSGDIFVYYQGNRYVKEQRYYFGTGIIGDISSPDGENYYASLLNVKKFPQKVPIYLEGGKYVEQLGYESVRKSQTPPWQSSIRPLSIQAYNYILSAAGVQGLNSKEEIDELKLQLKSHIRNFYLDSDNNAIYSINEVSAQIIMKLESERN